VPPSVRATVRAAGTKAVSYFDHRFAELHTRLDRVDRLEQRLDELLERLDRLEERTGVDAATIVELLTTPDRTPAPLAPSPAS
jgi:hypothetical protein